MAKKLLVRLADDTRNERDALQDPLLALPGKVIFDAGGNALGVPLDEVTEIFDYAPGTTNPPTARNAAMHFIKNTGVGTPTTTVSTSGGCLLTTTAADNDVANMKATTASPFATRGVVYSSNSRLRFAAQVNITALTNIVLVGLCQSPHATSLDPDDQGTDMAFFLFDPENDLTSGVATYATNWILVQRAASGTITYTDSGIPVVAGTETTLAIQFDANLKPVFSINGVTALTGTAWTVLVALLANIGLRTLTAAAKTMHVRYAQISRVVG